MRKIARKINPEHYFALSTGGLIKDLKELAFAMDYLSDEELKSHANEEKNDFSTWAAEVFGEPRLAERLRAQTDRTDLQITLLKHLVNKKR